MPDKHGTKAKRSKKPDLCAQCGKPAIVQQASVPLCVDCFAKLEYIQDLRLSRLIDLGNYHRSLMDRSLGLGNSPQMANFRPEPPSGALFLSNISIDRSNIGLLNTGTIQNLDNAITIINDQNQDQLANSLRELTEAVVNSDVLVAEAREEVLESLSFIADQLTKSEQDRKPSLTKSILEHLPTLLKTASELMILWNQLAPLIAPMLKK